MALDEPRVSGGDLLALGKVRQISARILLRKINILVFPEKKGSFNRRRVAKEEEL